MFKHISNQKGLSVAESVLSVGLLAMAMLGFYKLNDMTVNTGEGSQILSELTNFKIQFYSNMNSTRACKQSLYGLTKKSVGENAFSDFVLRDSMGTPIVTNDPLEVVDKDSYAALEIEALNVTQKSENEIRIIYNITNPNGPAFAVIHDVKVNYDPDGKFTHCENNESRTNAALCDSVSGEYNAIEDKCEFFNLYGGNYSAQQCEGLGGQILIDEETGLKYCNKGTGWYRTKNEVTKTHRKSTVMRVINIKRKEKDCTTITVVNADGKDVQKEECAEIPTGPIYDTDSGHDWDKKYRNTIGVTTITRKENTDRKIEETTSIMAYTSGVKVSPTELGDTSLAFNPSNVSQPLIRPDGYTTASDYYSPTQTTVKENLNLGMPDSEFIFEKIKAKTKYRVRIEFYDELPEHLKNKILLAQGGQLPPPKKTESDVDIDTEPLPTTDPDTPPPTWGAPTHMGGPTQSTPEPDFSPVDLDQPAGPGDVDPPQVDAPGPRASIMNFLIGSAYAMTDKEYKSLQDEKMKYYKSGTKYYNKRKSHNATMRSESSSTSCLSDKPLKHLIPEGNKSDLISEDVAASVDLSVIDNRRFYYEVHYLDIITEENIEREQTVYH